MRVLKYLALFYLILMAATGRAVAAMPAEQYALQQLGTSGTADFDGNGCLRDNIQRLLPTADIRVLGIWQNQCRTISGEELAAILKQASRTVSLDHVFLELDDGSELQNMHFANGLVIKDSFIDGTLNIDGSEFPSLDIEHTGFDRAMNAENVHVDGSLKLEDLALENGLDLTGLKADSYFDLMAIDCGGCQIGGEYLRVGGNFYVGEELGDFPKKSIVEKGKVDFSHSIFSGSVNFSDAQTKMPIDCWVCTISDNLNFDGSYDDKGHVKRAEDFYNHVDFSDSDIDGDVVVGNSEFQNFLMFDGSKKIGNIDLKSGARINQLLVRNAAINGGFTTDPNMGMDIGELQLNDSSISRQLDLSGLDQASWNVPDPSEDLTYAPMLDLTNLSVNTFTNCIDSFPQHLKLDYFKYSNFYHADDQTNSTYASERLCQAKKKNRDVGGNFDTAEQAAEWLHKSTRFEEKYYRYFSIQPYFYLAELKTQEGDSSYADDVLYSAKVIQMLYEFRQGDVLAGLGLCFMWLVAGFGLGWHFRVQLILVIGASLGAGYWQLRKSEMARLNGRFWCFGACLDQLLPGINLNHEFKDFFDKGDKPGKPKKLSNRQKIFFSIYRLWGWVIGFLVLAVMGGLTKGP